MFPAIVSMLPIQNPSQLAQLVGDTAPELLIRIRVTQAARRLRLGGQIVVAQIGIGTELLPRRLRKWINLHCLMRLRRWQ